MRRERSSAVPLGRDVLGLGSKSRNAFGTPGPGTSESGYVFLLGSLVIFTAVYFLVVRNAGAGPVAVPLGASSSSESTGAGAAALLSEDVGVSEAISFGEVVPSADGSGNKTIEVKKDGDYYFVSASLPDRKKAADKLAEIHRRSQYLLQAIDEQLDGSRRVKAEDGTDITDNMRKLVQRHYQKKIPFAEYHNPNDQTVGSNSDKGMLIQICLRAKQNPSQWNTDNTLFRVHVHELAHSADHHYREDGNAGHGPEFYRLMNYLLAVAENLGIYSCEEYRKSGRAFCGLALTEEDTHCG